MKQLDLLWNYQMLDLKIHEIEEEKKSSLARKDLYRRIRYLKNQQKNLEKLTNDIDKRNHNYNRIYHEYENINNNIKEEEKLIVHGEIDSFKQLDQIESKILEAQEKLNEKSEELAVLLKDMEGFNRRLKEISSRIKKGKEEYDKSKSKFEIEVNKLDSQIDKIKPEMATIKGKIDQSLLGQYDTIKGIHSKVMAQVNEERCGGCNMSLASLAIQNIRDKTSIIKCENCGRILYSADVEK